MKQNKFPPGWNPERVKRVLAHYESKSEEEAVVEDEAAFEALGANSYGSSNRVCPCSSVAKNFVPTHPGEVLLEDVLKPLGLTITEAAQDLGVNRKTLSAMVKGKCSLTVEMAIRIAQATGTSPESWLNMQTKLNLRQALKNKPRYIVLFPRLDKVAM
jgi:addiction module HigA family antidote